MNIRIEEKPLTAEQQKIVQEGFDRIDEELFHAKNRIRTFSWVVESPPPVFLSEHCKHAFLMEIFT